MIAFALAALSRWGTAEPIDRIAAIVDDQVITTSEVRQLAGIRLLPTLPGESDDAYLARTLDDLINQTIRYRDVQRFGIEPVTPSAIDARIAAIARHFDSPEEFQEALTGSGMAMGELRARLTRRLDVERHIEESFAPLVFVSLDEIDRYYYEIWLPERLARDLPRVAVADVRDELRSTLRAARLAEEVDRWTAQLRGRANIDIYGVR